MTIRAMRPDLFEITEDRDNTDISLRKSCGFLVDRVLYYMMCTTEADFMKITRAEKCPFRQYEIEKISWLKRSLEHAHRN